MKQTKRLLSFILAFVMLASCAVFTAQAATTPKYDIDFVYDVDSETAKATISIKGDSYLVGRFGFGYNTEALTLATADGDAYNSESDKMADVVIGASTDKYDIVATEETNLASELIDTDNGTVLFAWYATNEKDALVNAKSAAVLATVNFIVSDEIKNAENPADALLGVEDLITPVTDDVIGEDAEGWENVYVASDDEAGKNVSDSSDVAADVSASADISKIKVAASADGTTINVNWKSVDNETEEADIAKYVVTVYDNDGNAVASTEVEAIEDNLNSKDRYTAKFTKDDGIEKNTKYTIVVTPVTEAGNPGASASASVKTGSSGTTTGGSLGGTTTSGSGVSLTYTVLYLPGEGTIPDGQKFKYEVARNGYVSGSPAVVAPEGKVFAGWSVDGVTLISVQVYKITKDTTFKAIYVEREEDTHRPFILGYPGGEVRAENALTRAEAAAIIARASEGFDEEKAYTEVYFKDVAPDHWAYKYIAYVYENGIVNGYEDSTFHPDSKITRAEFATIMQRYLGLTLNEDASFVDVAKDHWAVAYIGACKDAGLINGYEDGTFKPSNEITRAEAVKILNRATDRVPTATAIDAYIAEKGIPFEDLAKGVWYFYEIMEAAFPHLISYYH